MKRDTIARPLGLALGMIMCTACIAPSPLGMLESESDTDSGSGTEGSMSSTSVSSTGVSSTSASSTTFETTGVDTDDTSDTMIDPGTPPVGPAAIDILFVFDNSGSMGEEQGALAASIDDMVSALEQIEGVSYRIGVTTTDNGNPWCGTTTPEAGKLQLSSCRQRMGDFVFNGNPPDDATAEACTDICTLDDIPILPTTTELDPDAKPRPWIEGGAGGTNLDGVSIGDALRCALPQGIAGCGFEQPLESTYKAMLRSQKADESQYGFVRSNAHLAIIFVTDETDCSNNDDYQSIFLPASMGGNPDVFWSDPTASAPTSAVCWRAGVECSGGPGAYDECHSVNRDVDGGVGVNDDDAVLRPISRYQDYFSVLLDQKRAQANASVFMFGVLGVPPGYPANPIQYADAVDATEQNDFGIGPGCTSEYGSARPPVREREVIEAFQYEGMAAPLYSICEPPLASVYSGIVAELAPYLGGG